MPNTIDGQYILYVLLIFSFLSDIFPENDGYMPEIHYL